MTEQYADSDCQVNASSAGGIRITALAAAKLAKVETKKRESDPVSEFLRELISRWEASGKLIKDLAKAAGLAKSMPSQIKARTSNASFYSAAKLAKPFGYKDLPDLVSAAWTWWESDRKTIPGGHRETARTEAMRIVAEYGVTQEQMARVLERFPLPKYEHADALWWMSRFHEERSLDAEHERELLALGREKAIEAKGSARHHAEHQALVERTREAAPKRSRRQHTG